MENNLNIVIICQRLQVAVSRLESSWEILNNENSTEKVLITRIVYLEFHALNKNFQDKQEICQVVAQNLQLVTESVRDLSNWVFDLQPIFGI